MYIRQRRHRRLVIRSLIPIASVLFGAGILLAPAATAQTAVVRGYVTDASNGEHLPAVNIVLRRDDALIAGTSSDNAGFYVLSGIVPGRYVLQASFVGYGPHADTLFIEAGELVGLDIALVPEATELREIVVEADETGGAADLAAGRITADPADIELIPAPDVSGDLVGYLAAQPGVVSSGDLGGQFFIRGGEPTQNLVMLDGMPILQPFHLLGFYSAFPADILNQAEIYAGGFGGRYGFALSSVIDVTARNGNKLGYEGAVTAAPFVSSIRLEGPISLSRGTSPRPLSFLASFRHSVIEQVAEHLVDRPLPFLFNDAFALIHGNLSDRSQLSVSALRTYDRGTLEQRPDVSELDELRWTNEALGARYRYLPSKLPVLFEFDFSITRLKSELGPAFRPLRRSYITRYNSSAHITHFTRAGALAWGLFAQTFNLDNLAVGLFQGFAAQYEWLNEFGFYVNPEFDFGDDLHVSPGIRIHTFPHKAGTVIEPRIRAEWRIGAGQVNAAAGVYHQSVIGVTDRRDATSIFTVWTDSPQGKVSRAVHAILGYQRSLGGGVEVVLEGYFKHFPDLFIAEWTAYPRLTTRLQPADGRAVGLDFRAELRRPHFYGYVNYGLSSVVYDAKQASLALWYGTETLRFRPAHDRRHQLNVVATTSVFGIDLSARWHFGSGLPFNRAVGFDGFVLMDDAVDPFVTPGSRRVIYEKPFNAVLPTYHRLDVSAEKTFNLDRVEVTLQGSLINAYDRRNLFYLDVFTLERVDQLPLVPALALEVAFR